MSMINKVKASEVNVLAQLHMKGLNRRVTVTLIKQGEELGVDVQTRNLVNFKKREISESHTGYTVETFIMLKEMFTVLLDLPEVKNKFILRELDQLQKRIEEEGAPKCSTYVTPDYG